MKKSLEHILWLVYLLNPIGVCNLIIVDTTDGLIPVSLKMTVEFKTIVQHFPTNNTRKPLALAKHLKMFKNFYGNTE